MEGLKEEVPIDIEDTFAEIVIIFSHTHLIRYFNFQICNFFQKKELMEEISNESSEVNTDYFIKMVSDHSKKKFEGIRTYKRTKKTPHVIPQEKKIKLENENPLALSISKELQTMSSSSKDELSYFCTSIADRLRQLPKKMQKECELKIHKIILQEEIKIANQN